MKLDLVMWTKNGDNVLRYTLQRINQVVPKEVVNNRFLVNDHSDDGTPAVALQNGWIQIMNEGHGISDAANTALKYVGTDYFCSFEQDVLLSSYWWSRVSRLILGKPGVAVACGLRFLPKSNPFYSIEPYQFSRRLVDDAGGFGKSLDNTIWDTNVLRGLGGFPKLKYAGLDSYLWRLIEAKGYKWLVDYDVCSLHLHSGFWKELKRYDFYGRSMPELDKQLSVFWSNPHEDAKSLFGKLVKSPVSSLKMSRMMCDGRLMFVYPATRLFWFLGYLKGRSL